MISGKVLCNKSWFVFNIKNRKFYINLDIDDPDVIYETIREMLKEATGFELAEYA